MLINWIGRWRKQLFERISMWCTVWRMYLTIIDYRWKVIFFHCAGLIITGGGRIYTDIEIFPANTSCTIPPFPSSGKLSSCSSSHYNCCQRETWPLPLCDQRRPCGVRWGTHQDLMHIVEERTGRLGGLSYLGVKLLVSSYIRQWCLQEGIVMFKTIVTSS